MAEADLHGAGGGGREDWGGGGGLQMVNFTEANSGGFWRGFACGRGFARSGGFQEKSLSSWSPMAMRTEQMSSILQMSDR